MDYKEFIKKYNAYSAQEKPKFIKKHIVKKYLPYEAKIAEARNIVNGSCYKEINGKKTFQQDSPAFFMLFMLRVILNYTDIEIGKDENLLKAFNDFAEAELLEAITLAVPKKEFETFNTVLQMVKDDEMENYRSIAGFFETKVEALSMVLNTLAEVAEKLEKRSGNNVSV